MTECDKLNSYLYYTTTIWMARQGYNLIKESGNDELNMIFRHTLNTLLDNMVTVLVTYTAHNMTIKLPHHFNFLVQINYFDCLNVMQIS